MGRWPAVQAWLAGRKLPLAFYPRCRGAPMCLPGSGPLPHPTGSWMFVRQTPLNLQWEFVPGEPGGLCRGSSLCRQGGGEVPEPSSSGVSGAPRSVRLPSLHPAASTPPPFICRGTLTEIPMALVPCLLNVNLKIGRGHDKILVSISNLRVPGSPRLSQVEQIGNDAGG